jgi:hypothetical protein
VWSSAAVIPVPKASQDVSDYQQVYGHAPWVQPKHYIRIQGTFIGNHTGTAACRGNPLCELEARAIPIPPLPPNIPTMVCDSHSDRYLETDVVDYDADTDDEGWLATYNSSTNSELLVLDMEKFEQLIDRLERATPDEVWMRSFLLNHGVVSLFMMCVHGSALVCFF